MNWLKRMRWVTIMMMNFEKQHVKSADMELSEEKKFMINADMLSPRTI